MRCSGNMDAGASRAVCTMQKLNELFQRYGVDPGEIAGTSLVGEIPIRETLINRFIARKLAGHPHVASVHVTLLEAD